MLPKKASKGDKRRNGMGRIPKLSICLLGVLISLVLAQSATAENIIHLKSWCTISVPDFIPDFSTWHSRFVPTFTHPSLFIFYVEAKNPDNPCDFLTLYVAHEIKDDSSGKNVIIAIGKSLLAENGEVFPLRVAADQEYLQTGIPSFQFTEVPQYPGMEFLIEIKTAGRMNL